MPQGNVSLVPSTGSSARPSSSRFHFSQATYTHTNFKTHNQYVLKGNTSLPGCLESTMDSDAIEEQVIMIFQVDRKENKK